MIKSAALGKDVSFRRDSVLLPSASGGGAGGRKEAAAKSGGKSRSISRMKKNDTATGKERKREVGGVKNDTATGKERKREGERVKVDKKRRKNSKEKADDGSAFVKVEKESRRKEDKKKDKLDDKNTRSSNIPSSISARSIGSCSFPMSRVWRLVRSEGGNSAINDSRTTHDAIFLINRASEMFLGQFTEDAFANAMQDHARSIAYCHLSSIVPDLKRYDFLSEFVPEKLRAEDALKVNAAVDAGAFTGTEI